ncbi:MAG: RIP metalloprotease RseP, partial [Gemmatimonadota bacterium]
MVTTILAAAVVLGVLIFVHELGHFLTAKWADIEVPRFSIGFGPRILGFRRGETEYVISLLPLGGYVKMAGMEEMEDIEGGSSGPGSSPDAPRKKGPRDFESKSLLARTVVISAGVVMNLLFAFAAFSAIGMIWGVRAPTPPVIGNVVEEFLPAGTEALAALPRLSRIDAVGNDTIPDFDTLPIAFSTVRAGPVELRFANAPSITIEVPAPDSERAMLIASLEPVTRADPVLDSILPGEAADRAGLEAGDRILDAGGRPIASWQEFGDAIENSDTDPLPLVIERGADTVHLAVTPDRRSLPGGHTYNRIGVTGRTESIPVERTRLGPVHAVIWGANETWRWVRLTVNFLGGMFSGRISPRNVGGPILISQVSGEAARAGLEALLNFMALLSVNLAILNLLPIPVLDGGHLLFLLIEGVRGRPVSLEQRIRLTKVGFFLILALMTFAIGN